MYSLLFCIFIVIVYNPGFEVIGENSMCFMSNLNNSQLSAQCYDVETITTGSDYAYKVITGNNEGPGEYVCKMWNYFPSWKYYNIYHSTPVIYCTSTGQNVSVDEGSIACGHHEVFQTLRPPLTTVSTVPSEGWRYTYHAIFRQLNFHYRTAVHSLILYLILPDSLSSILWIMFKN